MLTTSTGIFFFLICKVIVVEYKLVKNSLTEKLSVSLEEWHHFQPL